MSIGNRIITKGFGPSRGVTQRAGIITQGYGGVPEFLPVVIDTFVKRATYGRSGKTDERLLKDLGIITVWAKLLSANDKTIINISGKTSSSRSLKRKKAIAEYVSSHLNNIKIIVKKLK